MKYDNTKYKEYLKSDIWKEISTYVIQRDKVCQRCGRDNCLEVHHKTYEHIFNEIFHLEDLECLCRRCHNDTHLEINLKDKDSIEYWINGLIEQSKKRKQKAYLSNI